MCRFLGRLDDERPWGGVGEAPRQEIAGERIAATVDAVDYVLYASLANINAVMRGGLMSLIEVRLMCVGGGPTLDFADASAFLAAFEPMIDTALKRRLQ